MSSIIALLFTLKADFWNGSQKLNKMIPIRYHKSFENERKIEQRLLHSERERKHNFFWKIELERRLKLSLWVQANFLSALKLCYIPNRLKYVDQAAVLF